MNLWLNQYILAEPMQKQEYTTITTRKIIQRQTKTQRSNINEIKHPNEPTKRQAHHPRLIQKQIQILKAITILPS